MYRNLICPQGNSDILPLFVTVTTCGTTKKTALAVLGCFNTTIAPWCFPAAKTLIYNSFEKMS